MPLLAKRTTVTIALIGVLAIIIVAGIFYPPSQWIPAARLGEALQSAGVTGVLLFMFCGILATAAGLPRQMVAFIAGLAYGTLPGLCVSLISALLGCYLTVRLSHRFLSPWIQLNYPGMVDTLNKLLKRDVFLKVLVLRLQPLGTNLLTNLCIGFCDVPHRLFIAASGVGYIPQMLVFALLGSGVRVGSGIQIWISVILLCISVLLGVYLYRRHIETSGTP